MSEATELLTAIRDSLARIEAMIGEELQRKKAPKKKGNRTAARDRGLCEQGRAECVDEKAVMEIVLLWKEICPRHPQPIKLTDRRKLELDRFWQSMGKDKEAVQGVFESVAASRFLSYPPKSFVSLFWVLEEKNLTELMEGKYA